MSDDRRLQLQRYLVEHIRQFNNLCWSWSSRRRKKSHQRLILQQSLSNEAFRWLIIRGGTSSGIFSVEAFREGAIWRYDNYRLSRWRFLACLFVTNFGSPSVPYCLNVVSFVRVLWPHIFCSEWKITIKGSCRMLRRKWHEGRRITAKVYYFEIFLFL